MTLDCILLYLLLVPRQLVLACLGTVPCMCYLHVSDLGQGGSRSLEFPTSDLTQMIQDAANQSPLKPIYRDTCGEVTHISSVQCLVSSFLLLSKKLRVDKLEIMSKDLIMAGSQFYHRYCK